MGNNEPSWCIELDNSGLGWSYRAYEITSGLPSAISLKGFAFSRNGALNKAKKHIAEQLETKNVERVYFNGA